MTHSRAMWQRIWHTSIKNRLTFLFFTITAGAILVLYFYVVPQLESKLTSQKIDALERDAAAYAQPFEQAIGQEVTATQLDALTNSLSERTGARVTLMDIPVDEIDPGNLEASPPYVVSDSSRADAPLQPSFDLVLEAFRSGTVKTSSSGEGGDRLAQAARPIFYQGQPSWVVVFSEPLDEVEDTVGVIQRQVLIAGLIALVLAVVTGYYAASVLARRVKRLERAVGEVAAGNFSEPIPVDSADELGQLAQKFNEMQWRLARLDTARKEFIANASHELRTPIFSLGGFVELLQDEELDESTRDEFLATMREQVDRLGKLTTDLLDLSRLDAGSMELELEPVPLRTLANQVTGEFAAAAARKGATIDVVDRDADLDVEAMCDPERVAQIVRVLVDNALVHTPDQTTVTITAQARHEPGAPPVAELRVADDGPGIRRRELAHVFERFHTSDSGQGSGLGLAIARELAHRMEGTLEVASRPGSTTFTLALPLAPEREPRPRRAGATPRMRRASLAIAGVLVCAALLFGCGGDDEGGTTTSGSTSTVERTRVQVVEGLGGKDGFNPAAIYERLSPGVVTITSLFGDQSLREILSGEGDAGQGSGFVLNGDGYVVTNAHVITNGTGTNLDKAREVYVQFADGNQVEGKITGFDPNADVGLVKIDPKGLELVPLSFAPTNEVQVGEPVAAIGSPFGEQSSLSIGVVSAKDRTIEALTDFSISDAIQTDAAINRGNSGGPLLDARGRVIGINSQIRSSGGGSVGVGFAVSGDMVKRSIRQIRAGGEARYAYIGISSQRLYPQLADKLGIPVDSGAIVAEVVDGGPADKAGIRGGGKETRFQATLVRTGGDVITKVDGRELTRETDFSELVTRYQPGDRISLELYRDGERRNATVTLAERPDKVPEN